MKGKNRLFPLLYIPILIGFTVYLLLDTFVIGRVYQQVTPPTTAPQETTAAKQETVPAAPVITEDSYSDGNISITLTQYREHDTSIYVADIRLSSPDDLKTGLAQGSYGRNVKQTTSEMAEEHNAILAINGDYYGARDTGFVVRNGTLYRDVPSDRQALVIDSDGRFQIVEEQSTSAQELIRSGAQQVLSFGPGLISDGEIFVDPNTEVDQATHSNPRTAIAQVDELHYLMVVSDGRTSRSQGLSLYQLAEFLQKLGAETAYNLDGGGSSTMWFNGSVVNEPVNRGSKISERRVSDIVYIGA